MIIVVHGPEWKRVRAQLLKEERTLDERLQRAQRRIVNALAEEAQAKVLRVEVRGGPSRHTGLRRRVAAGVKTTHSGGESNVSTRMRQPDERNLPLALDRPQGWSHPLFGNRRFWYRQQAIKPHWFTGTFRDADERLSDRLMGELEDAVDRIARAG